MQHYKSSEARAKALAVLNAAADKLESQITDLVYKMAKYHPHTVNYIILRHEQIRTHVTYQRIVNQIAALEWQERKARQ